MTRVERQVRNAGTELPPHGEVFSLDDVSFNRHIAQRLEERDIIVCVIDTVGYRAYRVID